MKLDQAFVADQRARIEAAVLDTMEPIYLDQGTTHAEDFLPHLKPIEKIVNFYDYRACGISVLAQLAARGEERAVTLIDLIRQNCDYYRTEIYNHPCPGREGNWTVPLRRLLYFLARTYETLLPAWGEERVAWCCELIEQQVPVAIKHNHDFFPGETDLHMTSANNHTAMFMKGVYHCGRVLRRDDWMELAREFAERFYDNGHPDGYWEEHTNEAREGGPSMVYTPLSAGCLYNVLDGKNHPRDKFLKAVTLFHHFLNADFARIPLADERTNAAHGKRPRGAIPGIALAMHTLTPEGRYAVMHGLQRHNYSRMSPEALATIYHELEHVTEGDCSPSENLQDGSFRLTLPLGVLRKNGFTAALSGLRALNREKNPNSDYALDQQSMVYLSHKDHGPILSGLKSKRDPAFSTFRIGDDAYTVRTGTLELGDTHAKATLHYETFDATIEWDLADTPRLTLKTNSDQTVTTALSVGHAESIRSHKRFIIEEHPGFSPYTQGNKSDPVPLLIAEWKKELVLEFRV